MSFNISFNMYRTLFLNIPPPPTVTPHRFSTMTSHFRFHDYMSDGIGPSLHYHTPVQSSRVTKTAIKLPARNGPIFRSDQPSAPIHIPFPAQGYLDATRSFLSFDVTLNTLSGNAAQDIRFQNNIQSIFQRVRLMYGSLPLEDIRAANLLVRMLSDATGSANNSVTADQTSISEGVGGYSVQYPFNDNDNALATMPRLQLVNTRVHQIQNANPRTTVNLNAVPYVQRTRAASNANNVARPRRYQVQLPLGLFQQSKFIPLKFMASQLALEIDLAPIADCVAQSTNADLNSTWYQLQNVAFNATLLEYDASFDVTILEQLNSDSGLPIHYTSWNTYVASPANGTTQAIPIPERNRSLKAIFTVLAPPSRLAGADTDVSPWDSHALLCGGAPLQPGTLQTETGNNPNVPFFTGWQRSFQYRVGGKYYPADPVDNGSTQWNGGAESYLEFQKALNMVGDYTLSTALKAHRWGPLPVGDSSLANNRPNYVHPANSVIDYAPSTNGRNGGYFLTEPTFYVSALSLETSPDTTLSGINGEEQNDLFFSAEYSHPLLRDCTFYTFVHYDALLVLRADNVAELIK